MNSKGKHQCNICSRLYVSQSNLVRHIKSKHRNCNNLKLIFKNKIISGTMDQDNTIGRIETATIRSPVTPVTSELQQSVNNPWTPFRPLGDSAEDNAKSSSASTCLYADLEDFVNQDSVNDGSLPNPEPVTKRIRIGLEAGTSTDQSSLREAVAALGRTMETRLTRIENQLTVMQATIIDQISHSSTQEQHYMKTLGRL